MTESPTTARVEATTFATPYGPCRLLAAGPIDAPPLVLIHGYAASADQWRRLLPTLAGDYRLLMPDLLGFAHAPTPPPPYTAARWAEQIGALLDATATRRAVVVGHSLGGLVALTTARRFPERCAGLVLLNSIGLALPDAERALRGAPGNLLRLLRAPGVGEAIFWAVRGNRRLARGLALGAYHRADRAPEDAVEVWLDLIHRPAAHRAYLSVARQLERLVVQAAPGEIDLPTLIIWGAEDRGMPATLAEGFRALIPRARLALIADCGHVPQCEDPVAVAGHLRPFLAALRDDPAAGWPPHPVDGLGPVR
jgi:pimeloyl-ACP methyl ester carboxylesterase